MKSAPQDSPDKIEKKSLAEASAFRLTQTVKKGGCAAKVAAAELRAILNDVKFPPVRPELIVDGRHFDDAAVYRLNSQLAMVQTIDFFTPIVDSPYDFGRVAAANAVSDVYAMGGRPVTALAVLAFPLAELPRELIVSVLQGASDILASAGVSLAGGHSIDDDSLKFGLSVTGLVDPQKVWANTGARHGDVLILTKGLGTGTLTAALKRDAVSADEIRHAVESMATLNNVIDFLSADWLDAIHAATDITGFGFSGHAMQMAQASRVSFRIDTKSLPRLARAEECLAKEFITKAHRTNREYTQKSIRSLRPLSTVEELLLHDPQTSGGLLLSVSPIAADAIVGKLKLAFPLAGRIGVVTDSGEGLLEFA